MGMKITCPWCEGDGTYPGDEVCSFCTGDGQIDITDPEVVKMTRESYMELNMQIMDILITGQTDIIDKCNAILDKCNDILEAIQNP